jgi:hypothetical protein
VKTISLKKVSAVAVASLGFGLLSVVPANAAVTAISDMTVAELTAGATNLNQIIEAGTTTAGARTYSIYTGGASTLALQGIELVNILTSSGSDAQKNWIAPGTPTAAVTAFATFPATVSGAAKSDAAGAAVTGNVVLTGTPVGITTTTLAASQDGTVYTIYGEIAAGAAGTPSATDVTAVITVYSRTLEATLGDGGAPTTKGAVNGIAGPANTVSIRAMDSDNTSGVYNLKRLITVSGAGAKITTATAAPVAVATDGLTAVITGNNAAPSFNTLTILTPTVGTVTVSSFTETAEGSGIYGATATSTVTITVGATAIAGGINATTSTAVMNAAATWSSTTEATVTASRTASATPVAAIKVSLAQVAGAITGTTAVTATITGAGTLLLSASDSDPSSSAITGRSVSSTVTTLGEAFTVGVAPDGTSGVGTVTITAGTYTATKTVTFYGSAASYKATTILNATANGATTNDAVTVCAADSAGIAVPSSTIYAYSGDTTVATVATSGSTVSSAVVEDLNGATGDTTPLSIDPTLYVSAKAIGCIGFAVVGLSQTTKSSVVLTFGNAATQATSTVTTTATVNVGSVAATTATLTTDKTTYAPGEKMTVTLTLKDSAGRLVGAGPGTGTLSAALTSSASLNGDALFATGNTHKLGVVTISTYAPLAQGPVSFAGKTGTNATYLVTAAQGAALAATVNVVDANQTSLLTQIDALNAKIVALNALIAKIMKKLGVK